MAGAHPGVRAGAAALLLAALSIPGSSADAALPRETRDRADDLQGPQVHFLYVVPSDGADRDLDRNGTIAGSVSSFQRWLSDQTEGRSLRVDTAGGELDVTFARLSQSDSQIAARGAFVRDAVESELHALGFNSPEKIYAVYYDGSSTHSCGGAPWPPTLVGNVAAVYLHGRPPGAPPCETNAFASASAPPGYWEYSMLHETVHALGFVGTCAPHHALAGHVSEPSDDLMYAGAQPWQFPARLDVGHDDYYGHGRPGCPDLASSPFLAPKAAPAPPPALSVSAFAVSAARAGRVLQARLTARLGSAAVTNAVAGCAGRIGTRTVRASLRTFTRSATVCRWRIPRWARGKHFAGTVRATRGTVSVSRRFTVAVR